MFIRTQYPRMRLSKNGNIMGAQNSSYAENHLWRAVKAQSVGNIANGRRTGAKPRTTSRAIETAD